MNTIRTNIKRRACSQYSNFDIRSMCRVGDKVFGAGPGGLYRLTCENDDDGTNIDAYVKTFALKLDHDAKKRARNIYMNIETDGTVRVTPIVDGVEYPYVEFAPAKTGRQYMREKVGRGITGTYWEFKIENVGGCWFYLDSVEIRSVGMSKRLQ